MDSGALTIWLITDGKPGHLNQMLGLVAGIEHRHQIKTETVDIQKLPRLARFFPKKHLPSTVKPDLILCAGRRTHAFALAAHHVRGGRLVVCMRPSRSASRFDLCLIPRHDQPAPAPNVELTTGALVNVEPSREHNPARGLILVGGPSKHHGVDAAALVTSIKEILSRDPDIEWDLTTSRRTPAELSAQLSQIDSPNLTVTRAENTHRGWVGEKLTTAGTAWITEDSVSMICEALTSGCAVGLLPMPRTHANSRVARCVDDFIERKLVTPLRAWSEDRTIEHASYAPNEADRCAALLLDRFFKSPEQTGE